MEPPWTLEGTGSANSGPVLLGSRAWEQANRPFDANMGAPRCWSAHINCHGAVPVARTRRDEPRMCRRSGPFRSVGHSWNVVDGFRR